jgi:DNA-binding response OmpR family regulator
MTSVLIVAEAREGIRQLADSLAESDFNCTIVSPELPPDELLAERTPDLILAVADDAAGSPELLDELRRLRRVPIVVLARLDSAGRINCWPDADDLIIEPWNAAELAARCRRLLERAGGDPNDRIVHGDLVIDTARCEVAVAGRPVLLTFKEYELLRFLAGNPGRVFTRDALLNRVWGYDYFGGDRTVDVHVRRLRSKIEPLGHNFIETVRNIGYRFAKSE